MRLVLRSKDLSLVIPDVCLEDGRHPVIRDATNDEQPHAEALTSADAESLEEEYEAGIWYKVLVLDVLDVDCEQRLMTWGCKHPQSVPKQETLPTRTKSRTRRQSSSESMFTGEECLGYRGELDEAFDKTHQVLVDYSEGITPRFQLHQKLRRLLRFYILPSVHLTSEDKDNVVQALMKQEEAIAMVDRDIIEINGQVDKANAIIKRLQDQFLGEILICETCPDYSAAFIQTLLKDVIANLQSSQDEVEAMQDSVQHLKGMIKALDHSAFLPFHNQYSEGVLKHLEETRKRRDLHFQRHHSLLLAREILTERMKLLDAKKLYGSTGENSKIVCEVYMGLRSCTEEIKAKTKRLVDKKIRMCCVKEALKSTVRELTGREPPTRRRRYTSALRKDFSKCSMVPEDWQTLPELVGNIIRNPDDALGQQHAKFCEQIISRSQAAIFDQLVFEATMKAQRNKLLSNGPGLEPKTSVVESAGESHQESPKEGCKDSNLRFETSEVLTDRDEIEMQSRSDDFTVGQNGLESSGQVRAFDDSTSSVESVSLIEAHPKDLISQESLCFDNMELSFDLQNPEANQGKAWGLPTGRLLMKKTELDLGLGKGICGETALMPSSPKNLPNTFSPTEEDRSELSAKHYNQAWLQAHIHASPSDDFVIIYDAQHNDIMKSIGSIKDDIHNHFSTIIRNLHIILDRRGISCHRNLWLTYEIFFYEEIMVNLTQLYTAAYSQTINTIQKTVSLLTLEDLELRETGISDILYGERQEEESDHDEILCSGGGKEVSYEMCIPQEETTCEEGTHPGFFLSKLRYCRKELNLKLSKIPRLNRLLSGQQDAENDTIRKTESVKGDLQHRGSPNQGTDSENPEQIKCQGYGASCDLTGEMSGLPQINIGGYNDLRSVAESGSNGTIGDPITASDAQFTVDHKERFSACFSCIDGALKESPPLQKLQHLTKCLRELDCQLEQLRGDHPVCSDDIIDLLVLLLCNYTPRQVGALYAHIILLSDVMPPFFAGGPFSFSLVQFSVAYQFILDKILLKETTEAARES